MIVSRVPPSASRTMPAPLITTDELVTALTAGANNAGGWGYHAGNASRIEPTCWTLLALGDGSGADAINNKAHIRFLTHCQRADGLLSDRADFPANLSWTALGFLTLPAPSSSSSTLDVRGRLLNAITKTAGLALA